MFVRRELGALALVALLLTFTKTHAQQNSAPSPVDIAILGGAISKVIDGRTFAVDTGKDGKPAAGKDVVRFKDGLMSTALCIRFGFQPAPYTVRVEGTKIHFQSEMMSPKQGRLSFRGFVDGDELVATADWAQVRWYWTVNIRLWYDGKQVANRDDLPVYIN